jgi:hypothetical protein
MLVASVLIVQVQVCSFCLGAEPVVIQTAAVPCEHSCMTAATEQVG